MKLTKVNRPVTQCGKPVIKLVTESECIDNISGDYYAVGDMIQGSAGVSPFPFRKVTNIRGFVKALPRAIERTVSQNGRTQKVRSTIRYNIQGADAYPEWKMRELEEMLHAKTIIADGYEIIYKGGEVFSQIGTCSNVFRMQFDVEESPKQQLYGCESMCKENTMYFIIPADIVNYTFYNEGGAQVANNYNSLLAYYAAQPGVLEVVDIPGDLQIQCTYYKVFKVRSKGYIPTVFYYDTFSNTNKVIGMYLDSNNPDYNKLCRGTDNAACGQVSILPITVTEVICEEVTVGTVVVIETGLCTVVPFAPDWVQHTGSTSLNGSGTTRTLNLSLFSSEFIGGSGEEVEEEWSHVVDSVPACSFNIGIPDDYTDLVVMVNLNPLAPGLYTISGSVITFSDCLNMYDHIDITYKTTAEAKPQLNGDVIAQITGDGCRPKMDMYMSNSNNPSIPEGATLLIGSNGSIRWTGEVSSSDGTGSVIEITNIIYSV